jgi:hypothetical protein
MACEKICWPLAWCQAIETDLQFTRFEIGTMTSVIYDTTTDGC